MKLNIEKLVPRIVKWNMDRGLMDTFDYTLEERMLKEEAREFFEAWNAGEDAHMLQEAADYIFVLIGTRYKYVYCNDTQTPPNKKPTDLLDEAELTLHSILELLDTKFDNCGGLVEGALDLVITANESKPTKKVEGKIIKGDKYESPLEKIGSFVDAYVRKQRK